MGADPASRLHFRAYPVPRPLGDLASIRGSLTVTSGPEGSEPSTFSGSLFEIRQRQADGPWLYIRDAFALYPAAPE